MSLLNYEINIILVDILVLMRGYFLSELQVYRPIEQPLKHICMYVCVCKDSHKELADKFMDISLYISIYLNTEMNVPPCALVNAPRVTIKF